MLIPQFIGVLPGEHRKVLIISRFQAMDRSTVSMGCYIGTTDCGCRHRVRRVLDESGVISTAIIVLVA
jgi:hypothetical protein